MIAVLLCVSLAPAPCDNVSDHKCQAERYIALSKSGGDLASRVKWLYFAHREYLYLFDQNKDKPEILCDARAVLADALALKPTPAEFVERLRQSRSDAAKRERQSGVDCRQTKSDGSREPRLVAKNKQTAAKQTPPEAPPLLQRTSAEASAPKQAAPALASSDQTATTELQPRAVPEGAAAPASTPLVPLTVPAQPDRRRRARVGGAAGSLLASAALAGGMGVALVRRTELTRTLRAFETMIESEGRDATPAEYAHENQLDRQYGGLTFVAGVTGAASAIGVIVGVALLAKRPRQVLAVPWSGPRAAGLTLQGRF